MAGWIPSYRVDHPEEFIAKRDQLAQLSDAELTLAAKREVENQGHYYAGYTGLDAYIAALVERIHKLTKETT